MAQHRGLTRKKFVDAVGHDAMRLYLKDRIDLSTLTDDLTDNVVDSVLQGQPAEVRKAIEEDFYCINDVADHGMDYLERACDTNGSPLNPDWPRERVAMDLFVKRPSVFRMAYDWFLWRTAANSMSHHQFTDVDPKFTKKRLNEFQEELERWFTEATKGSASSQPDGAMCSVRHLEDEGDHILVVSHGDYLHTQPIWKNGNIITSVFRPAKEDVLRFSPQNNILSLKLSGRSERRRRHYIDSFGHCILGLDVVPDEVFESTTVSLEPIRKGTFNFWGNEQIESVTVVSAEIEFSAIETTVFVRSGDVIETTVKNLKDLQFLKGILKFAKLTYALKYDGAPTRPVPVEIRPPQRTIINRKRDAEIIESHLRENKVLLG